MSSPFDRRRIFALLTIAAASLEVCGCSDRSGVGTTYAVSGKVTLDGQPLNLNTTVILFEPDESKGNLGPFSPAGGVDEAGTYSLKTKGRSGAPPGWYRVIVTAHEGNVPHPKQGDEGGHAGRPVARSLVPAKYGQGATTDLSIEVVAEPGAGAYDLHLTSQ
ncbi:MAG TPA: hypothetical protein VGX78_06395 [Pirellulales bacterium]|nr:hypothetical protein [Pirellulales bacterium]